jgi:hypothetical protein
MSISLKFSVADTGTRKKAFDHSRTLRVRGKSLYNVFLLIVFTSISPFAAQAANHPISPLEQDIIEAAISQVPLTKGPESFLLSDATSMTSGLPEPKQYIIDRLRNQANGANAVYKEEIEDYICKNTTDTTIVFPRRLPARIELVNTKTLQQLSSEAAKLKVDPWKKFHIRYPNAGGLIHISLPGVDKTHSTAIIYLEWQGDLMAASGQIWILKLIGNRWILQKDYLEPSWYS